MENNNGKFRAPQFGLDVPPTFAASLGLAFERVFIQGDVAADQLPEGCTGCRVDLGGTLICCVNQCEEE